MWVVLYIVVDDSYIMCCVCSVWLVLRMFSSLLMLILIVDVGFCLVEWMSLVLGSLKEVSEMMVCVVVILIV